MPKAIGIGTAKSGTGTLAFLDCHPDIVYKDREPEAYPLHPMDWTDLIYPFLPNVTQNEFLIEKTPAYSRQFKKRYSKLKFEWGKPNGDCDRHATLETASDMRVS